MASSSSSGNGLIDFVFSWTLQDILNHELYKNKVENIPERFESVHHYLGSYTLPLIEETRSELCSTMEVISGAPYAEVLSLEESKSCGSFLYDLKVDSWRNIYGESGKEPYRPKLWDLLVLSDAVPEVVSDFERFGRTWTLALVTKVMEESNASEDEEESNVEVDDHRPTSFEVQTSKTIKVKEGMRNPLFAVFLISLRTNSRIWATMNMFGNLGIIKEVLCTNSMVKEISDLCSRQIDNVWAEEVCRKLSLNESQKDAVLGAISAVQCNHKSSVKLISGSPGTGKTKTVSIFLYTLLRMNYRALACAPTNVAVAEVALRILKLVKEPCNMDMGKDKLCCSLGDLLLFGDMKRSEVLDELKEIFLDYRVDKLVECFLPLTGWKDSFKSMIEFLENCVCQYHVLLKNESIKEGEESEKNKTTLLVHISFLEFIKSRYRTKVLPVKRCISILCTHLPKRFIMQHNFESMIYLLDLLVSFESLLSQSDVIDEELEEHFAHPKSVCSKDTCGSEAFTCGTSATLFKMRIECLNVLRSLSHSLNDRLPNFMTTCLEESTSLKKRKKILEVPLRKFCFQTASIFFCTASSSYILHNEVIEPLNLLVIDEAARLKECESAIPLQLEGIRHAILIGDECQLPALVTSKVSDEAGFGRSLFERLSLLGYSKHLLNMQYRMHPKISFFPNAKFYHDQILDAPNVCCASYERQCLPGPMFGPYSFISISDGRVEEDDVGHSDTNMVEVAVIMKIVRNLFKAWDGSRQKLTVGIISPYAAQVTAIQEKLGHKYEKHEDFAVRVKSVDGYQGGEEDIIIISTVGSNGGHSNGFLSNIRCTNVALTRARHCLWILGNDKNLSCSGSCWAALVRDAKNRNCFFNAEEDKELAKAMLEAKKELDQLDDLLNVDSILFKSARWKVLLSDNFRKSFGKLNSSQTQKFIIVLLLKLASGWRPKKIKVDSFCGSSLQLVNQFKVEGLYIISTVDVAKHSSHTQVLKIWDILTLEEIPKLLNRLNSIFSMYTEDFISRCNLKRIEGDLEVPVVWGASDDIVRYKNINYTDLVSGLGTGVSNGRCYAENSKVRDSLLLMKFYSLSSGVVSHLLSGPEGRDLDLPFEVTEQESEIILSPRSSFILGRSGTGKTTVLTLKLFRKEEQQFFSQRYSEVTADISMYDPTDSWMREGIGEAKRTVLRQMFVTVSPKLCSAVKKQISNWKSFICGGKNSTKHNSIEMHDIDDSDEFMDIGNCFTDIPRESYPLVITFQKFLMMLDGTMENSYFDRFSDIREFSQGKNGMSSTYALHALIRTKEVNYEKFSSIYWSHFNSQLTKKLDSSTVFIEIISHIKGGLIAGRVPDGKISREDYVLRSEGRQSTLSKELREMIYDLFLDYEKKKLLNGEFDLADLVIDLHRRLKSGSYEGEQMDFIYIDEVQDLTMRQIALFKYLCGNFVEGFVFSGDTAQTIARGIDFRFQDIRSLFYNEFILESESAGKGKPIENDRSHISDIFHLNQNFRTHSGVLKLSQSVIELLYHFFPLSIDILSPETSLIYGEAPILLESGNDENAIITIFGKSGNTGRSMIGFGAEQVILVRDDSTKKEIVDHIGKQALVLTIIECKGLEFQDVLLYNFFGTSPLKNQWRVVYGYMKEKNLLDSTEHKSFPSFSKGKHKILCSELKQLYVAITRTRQRLWICENIEELSKPIFDYWKKLSLVQVRVVDESFVQAMQVESSKEEWSSRGIKLFNEGNYEMATMCFERSGDSYKEKWAKASGLRAAAVRMSVSNSESARTALFEAAMIYQTICQDELAAKCFIELKEFKLAGKLYLDKCAESKLKDAGDCFFLAGDWSVAAEIYSRANCFSKCLAACTHGNLFDKGLHFIKYWKANASSNADSAKCQELREMEQGFLERCAVHYHKLKDTNNMMKFVRTFNSMDFRRSFLKSLDYLRELMLLEAESGNFMEAASIASLKGDLLLEADMLEKAGKVESASTAILLYVLCKSLWGPGSKGWPLKKFTDKEELLEKAKSIAKNKADVFYEFVCTEASSLSEKDSSLSQMADCLIVSQRIKNLRAEIISSRKILDFHLNIGISKYEWEDNVVLNQKQHAELTISCNKVCSETLIYFWNLWREKILNILEFLSSIGKRDEKVYEGYEEFCLGYLGVYKQEHNNNSLYVLLNTDAYWRKEIDDRSLRKNGDLVVMDVPQFVSAAQSYWVSEVISVGMEILEKLETLHKFSAKNSFSMFRQGTTVLYIFAVGKWLMNSRILENKLPWALQRYLAYSKDHYFEILSPLESKLIMMENMVNLRITDLSKDLIKEIIIENISSNGNLSHGQIGRVVMLIFMSGDLTDELYQLITKRFDQNPKWKSFIQQLKVCKDSGLVRLSLLSKFLVALQDTYNFNWKKEFDYISPRCFVYLLERLEFLVAICQGCASTTKSTLFDALPSANWKCNLNTIPKSVLQDFVVRFYLFIRKTFMHILTNKKMTREWLEKTDVAAKKYYPVLVLRLFILIILMGLNHGASFVLIAQLLLQSNDISVLLPREFYQILDRGRKRQLPSVLAEALKEIENPQVILFSGDQPPRYSCPFSIFINMDLVQCDKDIFELLCSKNLKCVQKHAMLELGNKNSSDVNVASCSTDQGTIIECPCTQIPEKEKQYLENENGLEICDLQQSYKQFWDTFSVSRFKTEEKNGELMIYAYDSTWKKLELEEIEECVRVLNAAIAKLNHNNPCGYDHSLYSEVQTMLGELKQLSSVLGVSFSSEERDRYMSDAFRLTNMLQIKKSRLEPLLDSIFLPHDTNTPESSQADIKNKNKKGKGNPNPKKVQKKGKCKSK